jgi:type IX secretion system PorP/SprF family membrane protein
MMKIARIVFIATCISVTGLKAQIATRMDQYYLEPSIINAAAINAQNGTSIGLFFNRLFAGVDGSPSNFLINVASHKEGNNFGFGGNFAIESVGFINNYNGYVSYAYSIPMRGPHKFTLAPTLGFIAQRLNTNAINVVNTNDPQYLALINGENDTRFDMKLSGLYQFKGLIVGLSSGRITKPNFQYEDGSQVANFATRNLSNLFVSAKLQVASKVMLQPVLSSTMFDFKEPLMQYGMNVFLAEKMWTGLHYAGNKNVSLNMGGMYKDVMRVGYSFSLPVSSTSRLLGVGHEVYVNYIFGVKSHEPINLSDRFVFINANNSLSDTDFVFDDDNNIDETPKNIADLDSNKRVLNPPKNLVPVINKTALQVKQPALKPGQILVNGMDEVIAAIDGNMAEKMVPANLALTYPSKGYYLCVSFAENETDANVKLTNYWKNGIKAFKVYYPKNKYYYIYLDRFDDNGAAEKAKWSGKYKVPNVWTKFIEQSE